MSASTTTATAANPTAMAAAATQRDAPSAFHPVVTTNSNTNVKQAVDNNNGEPWNKGSSNRRARRGSGSSSNSSSDEEKATARRTANHPGDGAKKKADADDADGESSALDNKRDDDEEANRFAWPAGGGAGDEHRQLLGPEEESSDRLSSDEDEEDEEGGVWAITREQLNYYTTQFFSMQPNPRGVLPGALAKEFFEKSRLPIAELRQIWQLSDVTKDGCLSLEEFLTAMHLVVLRRNELALPEELPLPLQPAKLRQRLRLPGAGEDRHGRALYGADVRESSGGEETKNILGAPSGRSTNASSIVGQSPGPKPVNFDFDGRADALRRNYPNLVQPVAVRLSPESPVIPTSEDDEELKPAQVRQGRREVIYEQLHDGDVETDDGSGKKTRKKGGGVDEADSRHHRRKRFQSPSSSGQKQQQQQHSDQEQQQEEDILTLSAESSADSRGPASLPPGTEAPPPPPSFTTRVSKPSLPLAPKQHVRSSSLDLNNTAGVRHPPELPPRMAAIVAAAPEGSRSRPHGESRAYEMNIHQYQEKNSVIARTINELHQEVSDALEERIGLEFQLEQLKSFGE